jgi:hypothetical protein
LPIHLGEAEDQGLELSEPKGRVFKAPGASLRRIKNRFRQSQERPGPFPVFQSTNVMKKGACMDFKDVMSKRSDDIVVRFG